MKKQIVIQGMHGMGDNIHQRAVIRQLLPEHEIWLETSWPAIYHDLVGPDLHLVKRAVNLRTQTKNVSRESAKFDGRDPPRRAERLRIAYSGVDTMRTESKTVLEAMCRNVAGISYNDADYRLPVPDEWFQKLYTIVDMDAVKASKKQLLVYRPLVERVEWRGGSLRNANPQCYIHLFAFLREHFHVISVADLLPGREWAVGPQLKADQTFHAGELDFEALAALFADASLVFTSSGFPAILAPALGAPCINIVGGYEDTRAHDSGNRFAPFLSIGPKEPCHCWTSACRAPCRKDINMIAATAELARFMTKNFQIDIFPRLGDPAEMFDLPPVQPPVRTGSILTLQNLRLSAQRAALKA